MIKSTFNFWVILKFSLATLLRVMVIDKGQPIKSLGSMSRDKIFKAFNRYMFS